MLSGVQIKRTFCSCFQNWRGSLMQLSPSSGWMLDHLGENELAIAGVTPNLTRSVYCQLEAPKPWLPPSEWLTSLVKPKKEKGELQYLATCLIQWMGCSLFLQLYMVAHPLYKHHTLHNKFGLEPQFREFEAMCIYAKCTTDDMPRFSFEQDWHSSLPKIHHASQLTREMFSSLTLISFSFKRSWSAFIAGLKLQEGCNRTCISKDAYFRSSVPKKELLCTHMDARAD